MASVKFCSEEDVREVLAMFQEESASWEANTIDQQIDIASDDFHAALATHFTMPDDTETTPTRMRRYCALQAAIHCIDWRYAVTDENVPDFVTRQQAYINDILERAKLLFSNPKAIDLGLTRKTGLIHEFARGSATDKVSTFDRTRETDILEPSTDMTESDKELGGSGQGVDS